MASCLTQRKSQVLAPSHSQGPVSDRVAYMAILPFPQSPCAGLHGAPPSPDRHITCPFDCPWSLFECHRLHGTFLGHQLAIAAHLHAVLQTCLHVLYPSPTRSLLPIYLLSPPTSAQPHKVGILFTSESPKSRTVFSIKHSRVKRRMSVFLLLPFYS